MARLTWHGHATFTLETDTGKRVIFDPFLDDNPAADIKAKDVGRLDYILCSHGHSDHFADAIPLAKRTGAQLIGTFELVAFAATQGARNGHGMNVGGGHTFDGLGYVKLTPALHTGTIAGSDGSFNTTAHGFWIDLGGKRLYHCGDSALITDMQLLKGRVDIALLPIGDNFTMGPEDAVRAIEFIEPRVVIPMHFNTWDLIAQDARAFRERVGGRAEVVILDPGSSYEF